MAKNFNAWQNVLFGFLDFQVEIKGYLFTYLLVVSCFVYVLVPLILDPLSFVQSEQRAERNQSDSESEEEETNTEVEDSVGETAQCHY